MQSTVKFSYSREPDVFLASVCIELIADSGHWVIVDDVRVLQKHGQLSVEMPSLQAVTFSTKLRREVEDSVLPAFEVWEYDQKVSSEVWTYDQKGRSQP
jgi:hypothetical protein